MFVPPVGVTYGPAPVVVASIVSWQAKKHPVFFSKRLNTRLRFNFPRRVSGNRGVPVPDAPEKNVGRSRAKDLSVEICPHCLGRKSERWNSRLRGVSLQEEKRIKIGRSSRRAELVWEGGGWR